MFTQRNLLFTTLLLASLSLCQNTRAQIPAKVRVIVEECVNRSKEGVENISPLVMQNLYSELAKKDKHNFEIIPKQEVKDTMQRLNVKTLRGDDRFRVATELKADLIIESKAVVLKEERKVRAGVEIAFFDVGLQEYIVCQTAYETGKNTPRAAERAAQNAMKTYSWNCGLDARIVNIVGEVVVMNRGIRDGIKPADMFLVMRETAGRKSVVGRIRAVRIFAKDAEADIVERGGFQVGDKIMWTIDLSEIARRQRMLYDPPRRIP